MGQDALYKISKAYAVYDEEVGYCQGLSFLAAALLLHVSQCQAVMQYDAYNLNTDCYSLDFIALHNFTAS